MIWPQQQECDIRELSSAEKGRKIWKKICNILKEISYITENKGK